MGQVNSIVGFNKQNYNEVYCFWSYFELRTRPLNNSQNIWAENVISYGKMYI